MARRYRSVRSVLEAVAVFRAVLDRVDGPTWQTRAELELECLPQTAWDQVIEFRH